MCTVHEKVNAYKHSTGYIYIYIYIYKHIYIYIYNKRAQPTTIKRSAIQITGQNQNLPKKTQQRTKESKEVRKQQRQRSKRAE